jgi:Phosphodiester glycosidase
MSVRTKAARRPLSAPARGTVPLPGTMPHRRRAGRPIRRRWRRVLVVGALLTLLPGLVSYVGMLTQPSDTSLGIRSVEWLRDNGARGLVNRVESIYYSMNAPATGGPPLRVLPHQAAVGSARGGRAGRVRLYRPPRIPSVIRPALPGEGVWRATFAASGNQPPVLVTSFRPDPNYPQMVAGVAWIDSFRTSTWLYPGRQEPSVVMASRGPMEVPPSRRGQLVATFNSAFKLSDSGGGFASGGHTYAPLKDGMATILRYRDDRLDIRAWTGGPDVGSSVVYARQNLPLIVDNGRLNPNLADGPQWGATLGNAIRVWRSGLGIDARGNLIYAVANDQTVRSLAEILRHAGAVRAMELDINTYWPSFITYRAPGAIDPANLLPGMDRSPDRYLTPDDRDFFAVYIK